MEGQTEKTEKEMKTSDVLVQVEKAVRWKSCFDRRVYTRELNFECAIGRERCEMLKDVHDENEVGEWTHACQKMLSRFVVVKFVLFF